MTDNKFNPDWDAMAVMVEEQQRMARRIEELTQREWVDLTNDEIDDIWAEFNDGYGIIEDTLWGYERAIEAKIREKNA
jgi:hypothetical protein